MGSDLYPFALAPFVTEKLALVHTSIERFDTRRLVSRTVDPVIPAGLGNHSHATFSPGSLARR